MSLKEYPHPCRIYALSNAKFFAEGVVQHLVTQHADSWRGLSPMTVRSFASGETCVDIEESVRGCDVYLIGWSVGDVNGRLMELLVALDAFKRASAHKITVILPMMPYARQDRKDASRQPITAKLVARLLEEAGADHIITMELHAAQIQGFFQKPCDNLYGLPTFVKEYAMDALERFAIVSPDAGGAKRARATLDRFRAAGYTNGSLVLMHKERHPDGSVTQNIIGQVKDLRCIIVDDMGDTCGTLLNATKELVAAGARLVDASIIHGVFSRDAVDRISRCAELNRLYVTDTCLDGPIADPKFRVFSVGGVFAEAIHSNFTNQSVSCLF